MKDILSQHVDSISPKVPLQANRRAKAAFITCNNYHRITCTGKVNDWKGDRRNTLQTTIYVETASFQM